MWRRVRQFINALTAAVTPADEAFVAANLSEEEAGFFRAMNLPDQRHALNVAYTARRLAAGRQDVDLALLTRCALLHDVGKVKGDVSTFDKTVTVVAHRLAPGRAERWGRFGRGSRLANLRHAFHIYFRHGERGADRLVAAGVEAAVVDMVRRHHQPVRADDRPELTLLRQADEMN
jgi:putative nucleotidyltransferase with HDIG domain